MSTQTTSPATTSTGRGPQTAPTGRAAPSQRPRGADILRIGLVAGALAGMMMAVWQMVVGVIANEPTAVAGISSSLWTAVTAIPSVLFGIDWFHADFELWPVVLGLGAHMMNSMMIGVVGVALLAAVLGRRPPLIAAVMQGVIFGLLMEVVIIHLIVNPIQDINTLYTSTPEWSWWASHAVFGMTLGIVASLLLRRTGAKHADGDAPAKKTQPGEQRHASAGARGPARAGRAAHTTDPRWRL